MPRVALLLVASAFLGCADHPADAIADLDRAVRTGDRALLLLRVTARSRAFLDATLELGARGTITPRPDAPPLVLDGLQKSAGLHVARVHQGRRKSLLPLIFEDGRWRADLFELARTGLFDDSPF